MQQWLRGVRGRKWYRYAEGKEKEGYGPFYDAVVESTSTGHFWLLEVGHSVVVEWNVWWFKRIKRCMFMR